MAQEAYLEVMLKAKKNSQYDMMFTEGLASIALNIFLFIYKYIVGMSIGSLAIIADAWHTLSDCLSSLIVVVGGIYAKKPADEEHPFGHGRAELLASFIIGVMLSVVGFSFFLEAITKFSSKSLVHFNNSAIIVMAVSVILKEMLAQYAFWGFRKTKSYSLSADGWHHRTDALTSLIILIGILFAKDAWWMDSLLSFLVSLVIFYVAFDIIRVSIKKMIGEAPTKELIDSIKKIVDANNENSETVHHFHIHRYGEHVELTFHMRFKNDTTILDADKRTRKIAEDIREKLNIEPTIHIESEA